MKRTACLQFGAVGYGIVNGLPATWRFVGRRGGAYMLAQVPKNRTMRTVPPQGVDRETAYRIFGEVQS